MRTYSQTHNAFFRNRRVINSLGTKVIQKASVITVNPTRTGDVFASESDGAGLYCGVTAKFVTPNLNEGNLSMEYVQYPARFSADPLYAAAVAAVAAVVTYGLYAVWMKRA